MEEDDAAGAGSDLGKDKAEMDALLAELEALQQIPNCFEPVDFEKDGACVCARVCVCIHVSAKSHHRNQPQRWRS